MSKILIGAVLALCLTQPTLAQDEETPRARRAAERFKELDANGDGQVTPEEFPRPLLFRALDRDGDGVITLAEVKQGRQREQVGTDAEAMTLHRDLAYSKAGGKLTTLDLYVPKEASDAPLPVAVFVHGGGWAIGDKQRVQGKPRLFLDAGYLFVSVNYRLSPKVVHPVHVEDVAAALAWLHDHVATYGGDPERMVVAGHSAGAHLAALVATDARRLEAAGKARAFLKGVILLDGAGYDIPATLARARASGRSGRREQMYETAFGTEEAGQRDASPLAHVSKTGTYPPFLILHVASREESKLQSHALANALLAAGGRAQVVAALGKTHSTINTELGQAGDAPTEAIQAFLKTLTPGPAAPPTPN